MGYSGVTKSVLTALGLFALITTAWGQGYPAKPVRIIVPVQAGAGSDLLMRFTQDIYGEDFTTMVPEYDPGMPGD